MIRPEDIIMLKNVNYVNMKLLTTATFLTLQVHINFWGLTAYVQVKKRVQ